MKRLLSNKLVATIFLMLCSGAALAGTDEVLGIIILGAWYGFLAFVGLVIVGAYFHHGHGDDLGNKLPS